jgi:DNA-binding beta-propeller fold protein YncE
MTPCVSSAVAVNRPTSVAVLVAAIAALLMASCHDARRANPLDPELTPAVTLEASLDDTSGTVALTWSPYAGDMPFGSYTVLRNVTRSTDVDTLLTIADVQQTSYLDTSIVAGIAFTYRVAVRNQGGLQSTSLAQSTSPLQLPAVSGLQASFDARRATAALVWRPYPGPRFAAYSVRRTQAETTVEIAHLTAVADTTFTDAGLTGDARYTYQIVVVTGVGEEVAGATAAGGIHRLIDSWPLDMGSEGDARSRFVRLVSGPEDRLTALAIDPVGARILSYDTSTGQVVAQTSIHRTSDPRTTVMAPSGEERVFTSLGASIVALHRLDADGQILAAQRSLFVDALAEPLDAAERVIRGAVTLRVNNNVLAGFGNLSIVAAGGQQYQEDFSSVTEFFSPLGTGETIGAWHFAGHNLGPSSLGMYLQGFVTSPTTARFIDSSLDGLTLVQFDMTGPSGMGAMSVQIGDDSHSRLSLELDTAANEARLSWVYTSPPAADHPSRELQAVDDFLTPAAVPYRVSLGIEGEHFAASITDPVWVRVAAPEQIRHCTLTAVADWFAFTIDNRLYSVSPEGQLQERGTLSSPVGETRAWQLASNGRTQVAVCLPQEDRVLWGTVIVPSRWDAALVQHQVGPHIESGGSLFYPLSAAGAPDGRMYVLDAGHSRIVAFDADGTYITHWGTPGTGAGQFDFGDGGQIVDGRNHAGSIAVDDEGFIYVADVFSGRIQRFAP